MSNKIDVSNGITTKKRSWSCVSNGITTKKRSWSCIFGNAKFNSHVKFRIFSMILVFFACVSSIGFSFIFAPSIILTFSPLLQSYQVYNFTMPKIRSTIALSTNDQNHQGLESKISCDTSHYHYDLCSINGPTVLDPTTSTFYAIGPTKPKHFHQKLRPYPRKWENSTMSMIKEVNLKSGPKGPQCDIIHNTSAVVFSAGGYTGNFFHDFNEGFLALFITVRSLSLSNHDVTLVIRQPHDWWVSKYIDLVGEFSKYPIINLDNETFTHCFKSANLGLISHGFMTIDPKSLPKPTTLLDFHYFLDKAHNKARNSVIVCPTGRPKLVLLSRPMGAGRVIMNEPKLKTMAEKMGFDVIIFEPRPETLLSEAFGILNGSHIVVGVHGAALTHFLFLQPNTIFIQIVPVGIYRLAEICYGRPAKEMDLEYLKYKIQIEESSLVYKYNKLDPILQNPMALKNIRWPLFTKVYLKEQNVELNFIRFRKYLKYAHIKAKRLMCKT